MKSIHIQDYEELIKWDEFHLSKHESDFLGEFKEGQLIFDPTYKYNLNSSTYDTSSKQRIPAWCDRILYEANSNLSQIYYGRAELKISDHRPVLSLFEAKIRKINEEAKAEVEDKLLQKYKSLAKGPQQTVNSPSKRHSRFDKSSSDNTLDARVSETKKRRLSVTGSVIEPSIGDFGLIEVQETH